MTDEQALLTIADAAEAFAKMIRRSVSAASVKPDQTGRETERMLDLARDIHPALGPVQARGLVQLQRAEPHGLTNRQVRELLDYEDVGTHQMLTSLCKVGLVERDDAVSPIVYRLGARLRAT